MIDSNTVRERTETSQTKALDALQVLRAVACRAPSGDNLQPWRITVNADRCRLEIDLDPTRDTSPMNSGQRMAILACGAAFESALLVAHERGWATDITLYPIKTLDNSTLTPLASMTLRNPSAVNSTRFEKLTSDRVSNRRIYTQQILSAETLTALKTATPDLYELKTHWITDTLHINTLAESMAIGDATMFSEPTMLKSFLENVRFDLPPSATPTIGLSLGSIEMSTMQSILVRVLKYMPRFVYRILGVKKEFANQVKKLMRNASGLCLIEVDSSMQNMDFQIGRAMLRAWLALTENGLSVQPMMSLPVLDNALRFGDPKLIESLVNARTDLLLNQFNAGLKTIGVNGRVGFLMRFGFAAPPRARTGRLPS
jgi:hypothetical protein